MKVGLLKVDRSFNTKKQQIDRVMLEFGIDEKRKTLKEKLTEHI